MLPQLALVVLCGLVYWLFKKDREIRQLSSNALWIPALLLAIIGTKAPSLWLSQLWPGYARDDKAVDQVMYVLLISAAGLVLIARKVRWRQFVISNKALVLMYLFWLASSLWAPSGATTFARLFKDFGCILVGMIFLTERSPWQAITTVFVRLAYVIIPLSLVLSKYFPKVGRAVFRAGDTMYVGVASHKNTMGVIVLVFGLLVFADLLSLLKEKHRRIDRWIRYGILATCCWVVLLVDSKTSLFCLFLGCLLFWATGRLSLLKSPSRVLARSLAAILLVGFFETAFGISTFVIQDMLGRDTTLTGRTDIWASVTAVGPDPLLGAGYYSFWDTPAGASVGAPFPGGLNTTHNGFLETYVDGGVAGVTLLIVLLLTWLSAGIRGTLSGTLGGQFTLVVWLVAVIYNFSEASFFRIEPLWFTLLLMTNQYRHALETSPVFERQLRPNLQKTDDRRLSDRRRHFFRLQAVRTRPAGHPSKATQTHKWR